MPDPLLVPTCDVCRGPLVPRSIIGIAGGRFHLVHQGDCCRVVEQRQHGRLRPWDHLERFVSDEDGPIGTWLRLAQYLEYPDVTADNLVETVLRLTVPRYEQVRGAPLQAYAEEHDWPPTEILWRTPPTIAAAHAWAVAEGLIDP